MFFALVMNYIVTTNCMHKDVKIFIKRFLLKLLFRDACSCLVVVGGLSVMDGFLPRLSEEILPLLKSLPKSQNVPLPWKCLCFNKELFRRNASWIGGSILGSLGTFPNLCLTYPDFETRGASGLATRF
eukprot:GHVP01001353.1.p1 GENE.GHVP01001353.1~~GHVP01001353.1.p1  ORF type:complete len:128 (-),score=11.12 GHVP01001353.1:157-540(-)